MHLATIKRAAAIWILKTRECHRLPQSVVESIIKDVESLYQISLEDLARGIKKKLQEGNVSQGVIDNVLEMFEVGGTYGNLFPGLSTNHFQLKYCRDNLQLVDPVSIVLGTVRFHKGSGSKRRLIEKAESMIYIPLLQNLNVLLHDETMQSEVQNGHADKEGFLQDYCDGENFKSHPLFSSENACRALQLILYYDELEICNPLGSKKGVHKIGMFYYTIGNLSPKLRSRLSSIQLLAVVRAKLVTKYKMPVILQPIVEDLKKLENGYKFHIKGYPELWYGTIASVSADNLGSNVLGGFKEGSRAYRGCCHCHSTLDEFDKFSERELELRSRVVHLEQCDNLEENTGVELSKEYGINCRSPLLNLQYFDMCNGALVADVLHDLLEGVLQYEIKNLLRHFVESNFFKARQLEDIMEFFEFGYMEVTNRPTPIGRKTLNTKDNLLKQNVTTASQSWLLGRTLPSMIGHLVPEGDEYWDNLLKLLDIMDILLSPKITLDETFYLEILINEHHKAFVMLYPDLSIIPKMHYIVHMPRLMRQFGPLISHWMMRFEARHKWFKRLASQLGNFINISYSLAIRHQQLQCYYQLDRTSLEDIQIGPGTTVTRDGIQFLNVPENLYRFGELQDILCANGEVYIQVQMRETVTFSQHYHAHVIGKIWKF